MDSLNIRLCMYLRDIYHLKTFRRKTHVTIHIEKRWGLPFLLGRYRARKVFAIVILMVMLGVGALSTKIWRIEVVGNSSIGEETLVAYLKEQNISYGVAKSEIDNDALELSLRQDFDEIIWASVYEKGTKLVISIQEKIISDRPQEAGSICIDLVAERDAKIVSIITRSGTPKVAAGDVVKAGDVLVSGRQEILDDIGEIKEYYYQSADADVMGEVVYDYEDWIPEVVTEVYPTGRLQKSYYVSIGGYRLDIPSLYAAYDEYETIETIEQMCLMDSFYLPVFFGRVQNLEQKTKTVTRSSDEAKKIALENFAQFLSDLEENGVSILDKNVMMEKVGENYHIYGKVSASESITAPALTEILEQPSAAEAQETVKQ